MPPQYSKERRRVSAPRLIQIYFRAKQDTKEEPLPSILLIKGSLPSHDLLIGQVNN